MKPRTKRQDLTPVVELQLEDRPAWSRWVTPHQLSSKPVHRWCVFPHSFTDDLVRALVAEWSLGPSDHILDPFAGAGTTLVAAQQIGIPTAGYDLSPFAVLAARVKTGRHDCCALEVARRRILRRLTQGATQSLQKEYSALVTKALPKSVLGQFALLDDSIVQCADDAGTRDFFRLALLSCLPVFSRAVATGGWLKWAKRRISASQVLPSFGRQVESMLSDVRDAAGSPRSDCRIEVADARVLPDASDTYSAVITSPPYPNRHDYTRVFGIELMFGFLDWEGTRKLRYQSFHSHPEARPERPSLNGYRMPSLLKRNLEVLTDRVKDKRVHRMIEGYFQDMYLSLAEMRRVCRQGAHLALVVGNAQYGGHPILVDELTAEIGGQVGLTCEKLVVARYRGNSAQQMGRYGRMPSRESVVIFRKP